MATTNPDGTLSKLTADERKKIDKERANYFKGSISVMVIYGTFILGLALIGIFSPTGKQFIFEENFAFTATFIGGTLIVIMLLVIQLLSYKPPKKDIISTDALSCPDYWTLKKSTSEMKGFMNAPVKNWGEYYCEAPTSMVGIGTTTLYGIGTATPLDKNYTDMIDKFNYVGGLNTGGLVNSSIQMKCNRIFPDYMNYEDEKAYPDKPNTLRCKFIEKCSENQQDKISWSSVCPS
jgi:hypothetical protein